MKNALFLAQSDTTAGFLSADSSKISRAKNRAFNKPILREVSSIEAIKSRLPRAFCKAIRRANKTTFIFPNTQSFRVVRDSLHLQFLQKHKILYSSSANDSQSRFDINFAKSVADAIIIDSRGIFEAQASKIFRIKKNKMRKLR